MDYLSHTKNCPTEIDMNNMSLADWQHLNVLEIYCGFESRNISESKCLLTYSVEYAPLFLYQAARGGLTSVNCHMH